jgi:hypothetical protein
MKKGKKRRNGTLGQSEKNNCGWARGEKRCDEEEILKWGEKEEW